MRPADDIEKMVRNWNESTSAGMDDRVLADVGRALERSQTQAAPTGPSLRRIIMRSPVTKLAVAAAIVIAASVLLSQFGNSLESVAWADVARRFESVPFFSVTIYVSQGPSAEAHRLDIWKSQDGRIRAQEGNKVVFSDVVNGQRKLVAFDRTTKQPMNAGQMVPIFLDIFSAQGQFCLDMVIEQLPGEAKNLITLDTAGSAASRETVIFEAKADSTPEHLLIWALRESKLPVRMRFLDPRNDECGDFLFDYTQKKEPAFFDPQVFQQSASAN